MSVTQVCLNEESSDTNPQLKMSLQVPNAALKLPRFENFRPILFSFLAYAA